MTEQPIVPVSKRILAILDVGHGNSAVLYDQDAVFVFDAGPKTGLLEYLMEEGIEQIDAVLISHADQDHIGGLIGLLASGILRIGRIRLNTDSLKGSAIWDDLLYELSSLSNSKQIDFRPSLTTSDTGEFDQGPIQIEILGPSPYLAGKGPGSTDRHGRRLRTNSISAVVRVLEEGVPVVLLPGDLDGIGLDDMADRGIDISAPILVFPHHGGRTSSTGVAEEFTRRVCRMVSPRTVIFSIGRSGRYAHPRPEVVAAVLKNLDGVWIICTELSEHCAGSLPPEDPSHLSPAYASGRAHRSCCGGTVTLDLNSPDSIVPSYSEHQGFVSSVAPTALCRIVADPEAA